MIYNSNKNMSKTRYVYLVHSHVTIRKGKRWLKEKWDALWQGG